MAAYALPVTPMYPSTSTMSFRPVPSPRPLDSMARRRRPRWGLRFLVLVALAGVGAHYLRPYVDWIDVRARLVEDTARNLSRQYGLGLFGPKSPPAAPAQDNAVAATRPTLEPASPAPRAPGAAPAQGQVAVKAAAAPAAAPLATQRAAQHAAIEPLPPRSARAGAVGGRASAKIEAARARAARRAAAAQAARARWAARVAASRERRLALGVAPGAPLEPRATPAKSAAAPAAEEEIPEERAALAAEPKAPPAPARVAAPAPAPEPPAPPPRNVVKEAASSGDELDRLMAGAVGAHEKGGRTSRANARMAAEVDRKVAQVGTQQLERKRPAADLATAAVAAGPERQPLDRDQIKTVMGDAQKQMSACRKQGGGQGGIAEVKVDVAPDGQVRSAVVKGALAGSATGVCVENKIKALTFPASTGLRFDYPMVVR